MIEQTTTFRLKVERALFDEEGNSRIRLMEEQNDHMERALFDEKGESRIATIETHMKDLLQLVDRSKFLAGLLWAGWISLGGLIGAVMSAWYKR